jgi:hypothetical protein
MEGEFPFGWEVEVHTLNEEDETTRGFLSPQELDILSDLLYNSDSSQIVPSVSPNNSKEYEFVETTELIKYATFSFAFLCQSKYYIEEHQRPNPQTTQKKADRPKK